MQIERFETQITGSGFSLETELRTSSENHKGDQNALRRHVSWTLDTVWRCRD